MCLYSAAMPRAVRRVLGELPPAVILFTAWLVLFVYAYPGGMTTDSFDHLAEARAGLYTDSHPPITSLVWKMVEYVIAGAFGMLIVQSAAFLLGLYAILRHTLPARGAAWAAALLFVFPPVMLPFSVIWKDCLMAGFLVLGVAGLLAPARGRRVAGLAALVLATGFRYNAAAATLPLIVLLFQWRPGLHWLTRGALGVAAWLAVTLAAFGLNRAITDQPMHFWHTSSAIYDLAGTIAHVDAPLPDAELERALAGTGLVVHDHIQDRARQAFNPRDFLPLIGDSPTRLWDLAAYRTTDLPADRRAAIERAWSEIVPRYPAAYLRYRLAVMAEVLSLTHPRPAGVVPRRDFKAVVFAYAQNIPVSVSPLQHRMTWWMSSLWKVAPIYAPWMYTVLALLFGVLAIVWRSPVALALCASGLAMEGSLLPLAGSPDYRYSHWLVIATCIAIVIVIAERRQRRSTGSSKPNFLPIT